MRLEAAIEGNLTQIVMDEFRAANRGITEGVREITERVKQDVRQQIRRVGLGNQLALSYKSNFYENVKMRDGILTMNPRGVVYTKAPKIIEPFLEGATIKPKRGKWLAFPTKELLENMPRRRGRRSRFRSRVSPETLPAKFGKLHFQRTGKGKGVLIARKTYKRKKSKEFVAFNLVQKVVIRKRLDFARIISRAERALPRLILFNIRREAARVG